MNEPIDEWQPMSTAPDTSDWVLVKLKSGETVKAHYACDLSGEEQPPFKGWFQRSASDTYNFQVDPVEWMPLPAEDSTRE